MQLRVIPDSVSIRVRHVRTGADGFLDGIAQAAFVRIQGTRRAKGFYGPVSHTEPGRAGTFGLVYLVSVLREGDSCAYFL